MEKIWRFELQEVNFGFENVRFLADRAVSSHRGIEEIFRNKCIPYCIDTFFGHFQSNYDFR